MKTTIEIEINDLQVGDGVYGFDYTYSINGKKKKGFYSSDYDVDTEEFRKILEKGEAVQIVLGLISES